MKFIRFLMLFLIMSAISETYAANIAVVAPKIGKMSHFGNEIAEGAQIAVDIINEKGGLLGDKLNLITIDDRCEDAFSISTAQMIALNSSKNDRVDLLIGPFCDNMFEEVSKIYSQNGVLRIYPMPLDEKQRSTANKGLVKIGGLMSNQAEVFVKYYEENMVGKNLAVVYDSSIPKTMETAFATQVLFNTKGLYGLTLFDMSSYDDYEKLVEEILINNQVAYVLGNAEPVARIIQNIQEEDAKANIFVDAYMATGHLYRELGNFVEGVYFLSYKNIKDEPSFTEKLVELRIKGKEPKGLGVYGYAAVNLWAQAVQNAQSINFDKVYNEINAKEYEMPWGMSGFENGTAVKSGEYSLYQVKNGEYTQVH